MLLRISCERCSLGALWTDDPRWFLETVCPASRSCEAILVAGSPARTMIASMSPPPDREQLAELDPRGGRRVP